jgi:cyclopropane fatty-acyl-phospholipid synthase-like methyltransferase
MTKELQSTYNVFKDYRTPELRNRHIKRFDRHFWYTTKCSVDNSVLEIGCGTGRFLAYLSKKGVKDFQGIDIDENLVDVIPQEVRSRFQSTDVFEYLNTCRRTFDRIVLFDVLEHFTSSEGRDLLLRIRNVLGDDGSVLIRVPNLASPWASQYQFADLTHKCAYTPCSMRQLAISAGLDCVKVMAFYDKMGLKVYIDRFIHWTVSKLIVTPPEIWTANMLVVLKKASSMEPTS